MPESDFLRLSTEIVAAYVGNNAVRAAELPDLIRSVYAALGRAEAPPPAATVLEPAVSIKKSVFPSYIVCLEDGKHLKLLKRHLRVAYGMTPADYRAKWGLPATYPMVAPDYAEHRSTLAKSVGLGRKQAVPVLVEVAVQKVPAGVSSKKKPSRKKTAPAVSEGAAE